MASPPARAVGDQAPVALPADLPAYLSAWLVADLDHGAATATSSLATALAAVPDARRLRGRRHEFDRGADNRRLRLPDRSDVVGGDRRVGWHAGPGRAQLPRPAARFPGIAVRGDAAPLSADDHDRPRGAGRGGGRLGR